jgi:hypothetical protein
LGASSLIRSTNPSRRLPQHVIPAILRKRQSEGSLLVEKIKILGKNWEKQEKWRTRKKIIYWISRVRNIFPQFSDDCIWDEFGPLSNKGVAVVGRKLSEAIDEFSK